jgi:peptidyl-prolyl cis-trans isomerase C
LVSNESLRETRKEIALKKTLLCITALALIFSFGCAKREDLVVAKVGDRKITVRDFENASVTMSEKYLPRTNDLAGKLEMLNHIIDKEVMVLKANAAGYDKEKSFVDFWEKYKGGYAVAQLENVYIMKKVTVTDQEVNDYFDKMHDEYTLSQILVPSEDEARYIREQIMNGADFGEMARKYSYGPEAVNGGFLGTSNIGFLFYWIEEALFSAKEGDVTQPLQTATGWAILKVDRIQRITPPKDLVWARKKVTADKQKKMLEEMKRKIKKDIGFQIYPEAVDVVYSALPPDVPFEDFIKGRVTNQNAPKLEIPEQRQGMIIAQYADGVYTIKDFIKIYNDTPLPDRPRHQYGKESIVEAIDRQLWDTVLPVYAEKTLKVLEIPEVAKDLQTKKDRFLVNAMYKDQITDQVTVSELEVRDYYQAHKDEIKGPEKRDFSIILVADKATADQVAGLAKKGESFAKLSKRFAADQAAAQSGNRTGLVEKGQYPDYDAVAFSLPEGRVSDPFQVPRGWAVIKVERIEAPKPVPYASAIASIKRLMTSELSDQLLNEKLAKWRGDYSIKIYERNLKKAELKKTRPSDAELEQKEQERQRQLRQPMPPMPE